MNLQKNTSSVGEYFIVDKDNKALGKLLTSTKFSKLKKVLSLKDTTVLNGYLPRFKKSMCLENMLLIGTVDFHSTLQEVLNVAEDQIVASDRKHILMLVKDKELEIALENGFTVHAQLPDSQFQLVYKATSNSSKQAV